MFATVYEEIFAVGKVCGLPTEFVLREEISAGRKCLRISGQV